MLPFPNKKYNIIYADCPWTYHDPVMGDLPRIELFARERAEGWDSWGDQI